MRRSLARTLAVTIVLSSFIATPAFAQDEDANDEQPTKVRRDPKGVKGISPYKEQLAKGRTAFANGDHDEAIDAFDAAIAEDSARVMGYLLKSQAQLAKGDAEGAKKTADVANNKKGNANATAKLLFMLADLREREASPPTKGAVKKSELSEALRSTWDKVKEGWNSYAAFLTSNSSVPDYSASATERKKQVDARVKRERDYGAVRERIRKNQAERDRKKK